MANGIMDCSEWKDFSPGLITESRDIDIAHSQHRHLISFPSPNAATNRTHRFPTDRAACPTTTEYADSARLSNILSSRGGVVSSTAAPRVRLSAFHHTWRPKLSMRAPSHVTHQSVTDRGSRVKVKPTSSRSCRIRVL
jgi:hypothetical protein